MVIVEPRWPHTEDGTIYGTMIDLVQTARGSDEHGEHGRRMTWLESYTSPLPISFAAGSSSHFAPTHFYWKPFFDVGYYVCMIPYRFEWDEYHQEWVARKNWIQVVVHVCVVLSTQASALMVEVQQKRRPVNDPIFYVDAMFSASLIIYTWVLFYVLWTKQKEFAAVFNFKSPLSEEEVLVIRSRAIGKYEDKFLGAIPKGLNHMTCEPTLCTPKGRWGGGHQFWGRLRRISNHPSFLPKCVVCCFLLEPVVTYGFRKHELYNWDMNAVMSSYAERTKSIFSLTEAPLPDSALIWLTIFLDFYGRFEMGFVDMLCVLTALHFWGLVSEFVKKFGHGSHNQLGIHEVMVHHKILKNIMMSINRTIGPLIFVFSILTIPFFCGIFAEFFMSLGPAAKIHWMIYSTYYFGTLRLAASGARKMENLYNWFFIGNHFVKCSQTELDVYLNEMSKDEITMKAGFIGLRDSHIRSILGLILTYSFVLMQFQQQAAQRAGAGSTKPNE